MKEEVEKVYWGTQEMADKYNISLENVNHYIKEYDIPVKKVHIRCSLLPSFAVSKFDLVIYLSRQHYHTPKGIKKLLSLLTKGQIIEYAKRIDTSKDTLLLGFTRYELRTNLEIIGPTSNSENPV